MRAFLVTMAVLALASPLAVRAAEAEVPPAAEVQAIAKAYAEAINADAAAPDYLAYDVQPVPQQAIRNFFGDQRWVSGGVEMLGARLRPGAQPPLIELALRNKLYGGIQGVELTLGKQPEGWRVTFTDITPAPGWAAPRPGPASDAAIGRRIDALVARGCAAERFSGAVLVAHGSMVITERACGEADRRYHVKNTVGTRFNLGSMDKMFTATAAMQLAEAGKLSLDATVDRYLDASWLDPAVARQITVWQLLTHTSGLSPDVMSLYSRTAHDRIRALDEFKPLVRDAKPSFTPGRQFAYSNTGMLLMGAVIEKASGEDYAGYIRRHVLEPAGMTATGQFDMDDPVENLAIGYLRVPDSPFGWRENIMMSLVRGIPAGGGYSTVGDLLKFATALQSGRLVSKASLERLWSDPTAHNYGAGFEVNRGAVGRTVGHSGLFRGVSTRIRIYLDRGYVAVVLANIDRAAPPLLDAIEGELLAAPATPQAPDRAASSP
jgi:CubicO group peptidase (beta-lactamase class C family)